MAFALHPDLQRDGIVVGSFDLCLVLLINDSAYPWFVLVPQRDNIKDAIDLNESDYDLLSRESRVFGMAIKKIFAGDKLNVAALGNMTPQLHVHHIVRFKDDAAWPAPIWGFQKMTPYDEAALNSTLERVQEAKIDGLK